MSSRVGQIILWFLLFWSATILQMTLVPQLAVLNVYPDTLFILLFLIATEKGAMLGIWLGFFIGLMVDVTTETTDSLGVQALTKTVVGGASGALQTHWMDIGVIGQLIALFIISLLHDIVTYYPLILSGHELVSPFEFILHYVLPRAVYTLLISSLIIVVRFVTTKPDKRAIR